ncbi:hypothetical protein Tco_1158279 [Tanacetum coccineum]
MKKISEALEDESWVDAMQEELESSFDLESYSDSDYAGANLNLDRKSITYVATRPRNCVVPNRKPKDKPRFNERAKRLFIKKQHHRESWLLFKSKKIAQVVRAWIKSKNSLVKHFEDMRLCRPSKEYFTLRRFRESLRRVIDGAEAFLILTLFILRLDKVSTDHAKLVPLSKVCTAKETLEKNTAKGTKCKLERFL